MLHCISRNKKRLDRYRSFFESYKSALLVIVALVALISLAGWHTKVNVWAVTEDWAPASFTAIANANAYACGLETNEIYCWGNNSSGQFGNGLTNQSLAAMITDGSGVLSGKTISSISAGGSHACAVASGAAYCWGLGSVGRLGNNSLTQALAPVAVDVSGVLSGKTVTSVSAGLFHTCAVASGAAYCWGYNATGQLGNNSTSQSLVPVAVDTSGVLSGKTVTAIDAGDDYTCAVASGAVYCWGANTATGQLGNNSTTQSLVPVAVDTSGVLSGKTATAISAGTSYTCAVASNAAYCWGLNGNGQLGNNSTTQSLVPVAVDTSGVLSGKTVVKVSVSNFHTCAVASSAAYCWGNNGSGRLGNNSTTQSLVPVAVDTSGVLSGKTVVDISVAGTHTCAIASSNAYCWGQGLLGRLGNGGLGTGTTVQSLVPIGIKAQTLLAKSPHRFFENQNSLTPGAVMAGVDQSATLETGGSAFRLRTGVKTNIPVDSPMTAISTGATLEDSSCGIISGAAYCWGANDKGELGNGSTSTFTVPHPVDTSGVMAGKTVTDISVNADHACAVASGAAYCWGYNATGQLGDNSTTQSLVPVAVDTSGVLSGKTVTDISVGTNHTCAVASGAAYCWGYNLDSQLGNGGTAQSLVPVAVTASAGVLLGKTVTSIVTGTISSCAIANSTVYCWGNNTYGQLGKNSAGNSTTPVAVYTGGVLSGKTITSISSGIYHVCVVASSAAYCWGYNGNGHLGNNSTTQSLAAVTVDASGVLAGKTVTGISAGSFQTCAVASGAAYCWGYNAYGQLGNNSTTQSLVPVAVNTSGALAGKTVTAIAAGGYFTCAIASSASYCWGYNNYGSSGNDTVNQALVPAASVTNSIRPLFAAKTLFKLRFAQKTAASCAVQTTGFADVTTSSVIAWNTNAGVTNGAAISSDANDPTAAVDTIFQTYVSGGTTFAASNTVPGNKNALWDFSLKDNSGLTSTTYCLKIVYATNNTALEQYAGYPEITTAAPGLSLKFVTAGGVPVTNPAFVMQSKNQMTACQTATSTLGSGGGDKMRVVQSGGAGNGWNVSIAPTNGASSSWARNDSGSFYDFNDSSGSPAGCNSGSDGDGLAGQLTFGLSGTTIAAKSGCSTTGLSTGSGSTAFSNVITAITITSASSAAQANCYWDVYNTGLSQTIPAGQSAGTYNISLTATVVAQ